jgi:transcriptional regulator with XRE-family HTH domain
MDIRHVLAFNIVRLRQARGLSQEALAADAGVGRSYLSRVEREQQAASVDVIAKLAAALDAEPMEFLRPLPSHGRRSG